MTLPRLATIALVALLSVAAGQAQRNWNLAAAITPDGGILIGDPAAPVRVVEYLSYTCPHCAHFEVEADAPLRIGLIGPGKGSVEYRSFLRNTIDVAATLLVQCGPVSRFRGNQTALLRSQDKWLREPTASEQARWTNPDFAASMRAIAGDLKLYELMEGRGYTRTQLDRCLANKPLAGKLADQTRHAYATLNVQGTPSFLVNGTLQEAHTWAQLDPVLSALTR